MPLRTLLLAAALAIAVCARSGSAADVPVDRSAFDPACGVGVRVDGATVRASWPMAGGEWGVLSLDLRPDQPLIHTLGIANSADADPTAIVRNADPVTLLTVGTRNLADKAGWVAFFDNPPKRPHETFAAVLTKKSACVTSEGRSAAIVVDGLSAGPFSGDLRFTLYPNSRLVHVQAVVRTEKDACAILYDAGLVSAGPFGAAAWADLDGRVQRANADAAGGPVAVRSRVIVAEGPAGSVAVFPPPHQFLYPLDFADNFAFAWQGRDYRGMVKGWGLGVRQPPEGDKRFVPWVNAPPGTDQRLGVFYLLSRGDAATAIGEARRFTRSDRFKRLEGYRTFTSHYHVEHSLDFTAAQKAKKTEGVPAGLEEPPFVRAFKSAGVDIVHLAEFHVHHTPEMRANRLRLLKAMHDECARLSEDDHFLLLPGEEPNVHLGGHWISFFPRPVYWTLERAAGQPFSEKVDGYGTVYRTGDAADVLRLMEAEGGLMWTAHPRIKGSFGFPDAYRSKDYYRSDRFLGAAWKAMPADLSLPRLGSRVLDLQDDMANWSAETRSRKYILGEVDVFKVRPDSELYGHMNVNYVRLDKLPRYRDGWQPLVDALRAGRYFVTTGEVLIPTFTLSGKEGGQTLRLGDDGKADLHAELEWTFPPAFAEVISGDGARVYRQRIDLRDAESFGGRSLRMPVDLRGRRWARLEVWDVAANGAFTMPVWIESTAGSTR